MNYGDNLNFLLNDFKADLSIQSRAFVLKRGGGEYRHGKNYVISRELKQVLCDNLAGWDGRGGGREAQQGGDVCIQMADSC